MNKAVYILTIITVFFISCNSSIDNFSDYMKYLSDTNNGLVKEKAISGLNFRVKYLPNDYLIYNELKNQPTLTPKQVEALKTSYNNSITFMMVIGPDKNESFDVTKVGVSNYQEFAYRIEQMNFGMTEYVNLTIKGKEYAPDLVQMESTYGLEQNRKMIFAFKAIDESGNKLLTDDAQFVYSDELFNTGINKFKFTYNDINALPEFKF